MGAPRVSPSADLRPLGPMEMLDRAFAVLRHARASTLLRAWMGGAALAVAVVGAYHVERVEGIEDARPVLALILVASWWLRSTMMAGAARDATRLLWDGMAVAEAAPRPVHVLRTACIAGLGLWVWTWLVAAASLGGPVAVGLVVPLFALRGAVAPTWLARSGCLDEGGWRAWGAAAADSSGRRGVGLLVELMVLLGALLLFANLAAASGLAITLARSIMGFDVAFASAFLSLENTLVLLALAASAIVLLEPLRAAISAVLFVDARVAREGLDLRAAVQEAVMAGERRSAGSRASRAGPARSALTLLFVLACSLPAATAEAQPLSSSDQAAGSPHPASTSGGPDESVQEQAARILDRSEFREVAADQRGKTLREAIGRLLEWLFDQSADPSGDPDLDAPSIPMPPPWMFATLGALMLGSVLVYLLLTRTRDRRDATRSSRRPDATEAVDPRERPPAEHLDEAAVLASEGRFRDALRALYLATLVALDRRRLIVFDPALTNWQYIRQMPRSEHRDTFARFTRVFDRKWYGDEPTTEQDYLLVRDLAGRICAPEERAAMSEVS